MEVMSRPHVLCIPFPAQGHINPMMQLAKLLYSSGFFVTFVNTNFSHKRLLESGGVEYCLEGFWFESIDDGVHLKEIMEDPEEFCKNIRENSVQPLRDLLTRLRSSSHGLRPSLTCVVCDGFMTFPLEIAQELGIPGLAFFPAAACTFMAFLHYPELIKRGLVPLKDESYFLNGYLNTKVDWIPGMGEMQLKDLGSFVATTDPNNYSLKYVAHEVQTCARLASTIIFNTFDELEHNVLDAAQSMSLHIHPIGPLHLQCTSSITDNQMKCGNSSMWPEERDCVKWLDNFKVGSVIYVNFGSTTVMTVQQFTEFAWGIANTKHPFLWVIRPDLVMNGQISLSREFMDEIEGRGILVSWCPQVEVLAHPSVAVFLTHCGWNSMLESIALGVPMLCWPFICDQQVNCHYACKVWGVGMEINNNVTRKEIGFLIEEAFEGQRGKEMRMNVLKWKRSAKIAVEEGGSSHINLELLLHRLSTYSKENP